MPLLVSVWGTPPVTAVSVGPRAAGLVWPDSSHSLRLPGQGAEASAMSVNADQLLKSRH